MDRKIAILLSIVFGILFAFLHTSTTNWIDEASNQVSTPTTVSCQQLLKELPREDRHLQLTNYQRGAKFVHYDNDQDGNWELAYAPLFPKDWSALGNNYHSVIIHFDDVKNEAELKERLATKELECQLWAGEQDLPSDIYSDLARVYKLMDFSRCVVVQAGFHTPKLEVAKAGLLGIQIGMAACGLVLVWNLVAMLLTKRRLNDLSIEEEAPRASLPDF